MTPSNTASQPAVSIIDACAHVHAAADLLMASADAVFDPRRALAGQLILLAAAIHPGVQAQPTPNDPVSAAAHLDQALHLLADVRPAPDGLGRWGAELAGLRAAVRDATDPQVNGAPR